MNPIGWLLGFILPACAGTGAEGLPAPSLMDLARIVRPTTPNTALAGPPGFLPVPDIATPIYAMSPQHLYDRMKATAASQPRTWLAAEYPTQLQSHYVARSAVFNFPDLITVQVAPMGETGSTVVLYSQSVYGYSDLGANRVRVETWLATLQASFISTRER